MYKSSLIGFFLLSSLIFGSANMMVFEGAAAQDYYNDDIQYLDSSSYSAGYRDDNNDNSYYSSSSSSSNNYYPPKDSYNNKKFVCKDGPFEGLLVSSVEYCKPADITVPTDFPTIQAAINASNPGDTIKVLPGIYTEQLTISKSLTIIGLGAKVTIIEAPPLEELEPSIVGPPYIVQINNEAQVNMKGFTIKGPEGTNCDGLFGITVLGDATLKLNSAVIRDCTNVGILVGSLRIPSGAQAGHATITNTVITDYTASGITVPGSDSTLTISHSKIIGSVPDAFGITGILFHTGAKATIVNNIISGNICDIPEICGSNPFTQVQAFGIAASNAGNGSIIANNYVSNNDVGIGVFGASECCVIDYNKLTDNRFFGITIVDGEHTISNTKIFGGSVGVAAIAITANTVAILDHVKIIGATTPVQEIPSGGFTAEVVILPNSFQNSKDGKPYFDSEEVIY